MKVIVKIIRVKRIEETKETVTHECSRQACISLTQQGFATKILELNINYPTLED
jgi:uncharacterized protein (UPF0335 family)